MCLLAVVFRARPDASLVIAANRDERLERPAEPMQVLRPAGPRILGGRDALAGGTWLAVNEHGVCAGLTNRPHAAGHDPSRRSRGELPLMLAAHGRAEDAVRAFEENVRGSQYNACWLLVGDRESLFYIVVGDDERPAVTRLSPGIHVLENRPLDAASAKVGMISRALLAVREWHGPTLMHELYCVLRSHELPFPTLSDGAPENNGPRRPELGAACVHASGYGTRSATLIVVPRASDVPVVSYTDGPPCTAPLVDASHLWTVTSVATGSP